MTILAIDGLSKSFAGGVRALDDLRLELRSGELVSLLGPSGCGKTTALRSVAGFERADSGRVLIDGQDISHVPASKRDMGMVFQAYSLFPTMTAAENIGYGLRVRRRNRETRTNRAAELLELVGLSGRGDNFPHQLSGGQQQRVALARALAIEPRVLLLDEPLSALDAQVRMQLREEIRRLQTQLGITTLFVTHDQEEALSISDRVGVMNRGRLEQLAAPAELYRAPATEFVAGFVGTINRLSVAVVDPRHVRYGEAVLSALSPDPGRAPGTAARLLVRPESLMVEVGDGSGAAGSLRGVVRTAEFHGPIRRLRIDTTRGDLLIADIPGRSGDALTPGTAVCVTPLPEGVTLVDAD